MVAECSAPAIKYEIKDARIRYSTIKPVKLEAPLCSVHYAFGPPSQKKTVLTFDGGDDEKTALENGREQMLRSISAAVVDVVHAMSPKSKAPVM